MGGTILSSGKDAIRRFVHEELFPLVAMGSTCPSAVNLDESFSRFLVAQGAPQIIAGERTELWRSNLAEQVERCLRDWEVLGVPRPMDITEDGRTFVTWSHARYHELTGRPSLPAEFAQIHRWVRQQSEAEFLFVCACMLSIVGANPILVTDASGDGGIDLLGRVPAGPLRSVVLAVQAKSSRQQISRDTVLAEYGKYLALRSTRKYEQYLQALEAHLSGDGTGWCYLLVSNHEFHPNARRVATELGIILRSGIQLAFWLAERTTYSKLEAVRSQLGVLRCDLKDNLCARITL